MRSGSFERDERTGEWATGDETGQRDGLNRVKPEKPRTGSQRRFQAVCCRGPPHEEAAMIDFELNGKRIEVDAPGDTPLLWILRDDLGLTGTKFGCGKSLCGACTIHLDGAPVRSCQLPLSGVAGRKVTTIEGLEGKVALAVQNAWDERQVVQCGYCQSGQVMAATALLAQNPRPDDAAIENAMSGNLCRCGTYGRVRDAIRAAAQTLGGKS